jgi:nucleoside-triphosphatase THEP1
MEKKTTAFEIATCLLDRERFGVELEKLLQGIFGPIMHEAYLKEAIWQIEGEYENFIKDAAEAISEVYSEEQQAILLKFHQDNPWFQDLSAKVSDIISEKSAARGIELTEKIIHNLEESGDMEKIAKDGLFKIK